MCFQERPPKKNDMALVIINCNGICGKTKSNIFTMPLWNNEEENRKWHKFTQWNVNGRKQMDEEKMDKHKFIGAVEYMNSSRFKKQKPIFLFILVCLHEIQKSIKCKLRENRAF